MRMRVEVLDTEGMQAYWYASLMCTGLREPSCRRTTQPRLAGKDKQVHTSMASPHAAGMAARKIAEKAKAETKNQS